MTSHRIVAALLLLASLATPVSLRAQTIAGRVLDDLSEGPISTTSVMLLDSTDTAVAWAESDSVGRFFLRAPGAGRYRLYADRMAYGEIFSETFPLSGDGSVELLVRMVPLPVELDALVVTAERRTEKLQTKGFCHRQDASQGTFFDVEDVQKWQPRFVTDLLRRAPGVHVERGRLGGAVVTTRRFRQGWNSPCPMKVVLDGFKVNLLEGESLDDWVDPQRVIGLEVYPGGVGAPVQHRGTDAFCGIIMIWTR
jgi:hypothetical protein